MGWTTGVKSPDRTENFLFAAALKQTVVHIAPYQTATGSSLPGDKGALVWSETVSFS